MNLENVLYVLGRLCTLLAFVLAAPLALSVVHQGFGTPLTNAFVVTLAVSLGLGYALRLSFDWDAESFGYGEAFASVTLGWLAYTALGSLPYVITGYIPSLLDACLETLSGFTTTGATVLSDPAVLPLPLLFWRTLTGWIGGMAFLAVTVAILPVLGAGGNSVVDAEVSGTEQEDFVSRLATAAGRLWPVYMLATLALLAGFMLSGLRAFDALCYAMSVVATCSLAPRADSLASFGAAAQWVAVGGMLVAGMNIVLVRQLLAFRPRPVLRNTELRLYFLAMLLVCGTLAFAAGITAAGEGAPGWEPAARRAVLAGTSAITTTGLGTEPLSAWSPTLQALLLLGVALGASSGSTAGGFKLFRLVLLAKAAVREIDRLLRPSAVFLVKLQKRPVAETMLLDVAVFLVLHLVVFSVAATLLMLLGLDMRSSIAAVVSALSNHGGVAVGLGTDMTWPQMPGLGKVLLMACMLLGRLEFYAVLVLFVPLASRR
ncbi:MAG: TrkH family potassium uptake protein [Planctomycetota bacterium]